MLVWNNEDNLVLEQNSCTTTTTMHTHGQTRYKPPSYSVLLGIHAAYITFFILDRRWVWCSCHCCCCWFLVRLRLISLMAYEQPECNMKEWRGRKFNNLDLFRLNCFRINNGRVRATMIKSENFLTDDANGQIYGSVYCLMPKMFFISSSIRPHYTRTLHDELTLK